jgi:CP2 transcription factor
MTNQADETPVTYLNKGHVYSVLIVDTAPPMPGSIPVQYRTAIRMSFQDGQQGQAAARHWKLWKDGRRTKDGHQCGGELHGVEYVEEPRVTEDHGKRARANLESAPLDGFSVLWTPGSGSSADCRIAIRFNFLSTDFTHSKGVKGILTRLCAKTEVVSPISLHCSQEVPEICFCEVKVFRDHGAERKLSNDIASVKKTINKLKQQISRVDTTSGKRRRDGSIDTKVTQNGPNIMRKRKRTWPMSSASPTKEDLPFKLQMMQDMLTSTRPGSVLCVRGQEQDDPDLHPVQLKGESPDLVKVKPEESMDWQQRINGRSLNIGGTCTLMSPLLNPCSAPSRGITASAKAELPTHGRWGGVQPITQIGSELQQSNPQHLPSPPDQLVKVQMPQQDSLGPPARGVGALESNSSFRYPPERPIKPGALPSLYARRGLLTIFQLLASISYIEKQTVWLRRNIIKQFI